MAKIFVSVPVLNCPELKMMYSLYSAVLSCPQHNVRLYFNENDSLISRVRNVHLSTWYNDFPEYEYFMSLDSDLEIVNIYSNNNIFQKLISHNLDFCGGLYAIKKPGPRQCSSITVDGVTPEFDSGVKEVRWLSSGCWCLKRSVVTKMIEAYPELIYDSDDNVTGKKIYGLYIPMIYDIKENDFPNASVPFRKYLSEDWSFCERWKAIGGKVYADTSIVLRHIGKTPYTIWDVEIVKGNKPTESGVKPPKPGFDLKDKKDG